MKFLITGKNGQLGKEFVKSLSSGVAESSGKVVEWESVGRKECDISSPSQILEVFESVKPDIIINCAAYNFVDKAETDYLNAFKVNAIGTRNLAFACKKHNAFLVHFSTDYVFDGKKNSGAYTEDDRPNPLCEYAKSKLAGEEFVKEYLFDYLIFRVSWLYGEGKNNFVHKLLQWAKTQEYLKIAYDEFSVPTSTKIVVKYTMAALKKDLSGLFHLVNSGYASRLEWAKLVFKTLDIKTFIYPVPRRQFDLPAKRPKFSAMNSAKLEKELDEDIPYWDDEVIRFCRNMR